VPGVGPDREAQAQMQKGIKLLSEYQQVSGEYQTEMSRVGVEALEAMRLRILEMAEQGKKINSLREIYDLWVDCNEKAYAELVYTDEYSELYGRLTNALLAVKQHQGKVMDKFLAKLNMPTRQGMNTVLKRVQEMKRGQSKSAAKIIALENELQDLRQMIEENKKSSVSAKPRSTSARKKAKKKTKKKTTKKSSAKKTIVIDI
jgi:class III poly(R)-hydroxyalkanoic acid synthase PhaE subunit